jgi:anti-sigma factor RsiW
MSACGHDPLMIQALFDGELDAVHAAEVEARLTACPACAETYAQIAALHQALQQEGLRVAAPERLRRRLTASLRAAAAPSEPVRRARPWGWMSAGAGLAIAASFCLFVAVGAFRGDAALTEELVSSHVRSLQVAHLTDIETSDHHVVKPWFNGKLDFSPPVIDLKDEGFPLVGGRLDYVGQRTVAAEVYRRGRHVINLFVWPDTAPAGLDQVKAADGYGLRHWRAAGMSFWAVSDVNLADLTLFEADLKARGG